MLNAADDISLIDKIDALQASVNAIAETLIKMQKNKTAFGDWVSEKEAMAITGLSKTTLLKLRKNGKLSSSSISGKQPYYRLSSIKKLLDTNEQSI